MKILGIDIGNASVKAVEIESAFRRWEIHEYYEEKIETGSDPFLATRKLIERLPMLPDRVAVALKTSCVTFRNLQLPTRDRKAIRSGVGFELEDDLPFELEQVIYDYSILSTSGQSTQVHVSATLKSYVEDLLTKLNQIGVDPDLITTEAWAYRNLLNKILSKTVKEKPIMLVKIGNERTILYVHWNGYPILSRELSWGGKDLTQAICRKYGIPLDQANQTKKEHGFILPSSQRAQAIAEQIEFSDTLLQPLEVLVSEIKQAKLICKSIAHEHLSQIFLTGGSSLLPGLLGFLEEELQIPTQSLKGMSQLAASGVSYSEDTEASFLLASALAISLIGAERSKTINLRKGELAKEIKSREISYENLKRPLKAVGAIFICLMLSAIIQNQVYKSRLKSSELQLEKSVRSFFGQISNSAVRTYMSSPKTLRDTIKKELTKTKELTIVYAPNQRSPLLFLNEISQTIPKDVVVDMMQFNVGSSVDNVEMSFLLVQPQTADKLNVILNSKIADLKKSELQEITNKNDALKKWKITFSGKPKEEAYGK
ncbi:MAG: pilus assembly protein PilM [Deltaproteobacteria bacterium]|nr:pilus assembly protein PilM [Deltaproteobacteria bacterium]